MFKSSGDVVVFDAFLVFGFGVVDRRPRPSKRGDRRLEVGFLRTDRFGCTGLFSDAERAVDALAVALERESGGVGLWDFECFACFGRNGDKRRRFLVGLFE